jgi:membrane protease YdiL (CAAX protease family)
MTDLKRPRVFARIALVRLLLFFFLLLLVYAVGQQAVGYSLHHVPKHLVDAVALAGAAVVSLASIGLYVFLVRWLERRGAKELAPLRGTPLLIGGMLLAFFMFCVVYAILWGLGVAAWHGFAGYAAVATFAAMAIASGVCEELIFRGGVYRVLEDGFGSTVALILSGALFGALHLVNHNATLFSAVAIALEAGVLLGAAYAATRNLWLPIGIHIGWNFTEGGVFGAAVSGGGGGKGILDMPLSGAPLLTGGVFGPEASIITVIVCTAAGLYFVIRTIRRGRWVPASFHMMLD